MTETIYEFQEECRFLSNFYPAEFVWGGYAWYNSEAAYQAAKCGKDKEIFLRFSQMKNPAEAKREGKNLTLRPDWETEKFNIMYDIVEAKFIQNPELMQKLLATGSAQLEEGNTWHDKTWGVCPPRSSQGKNWLGEILMEVRRAAFIDQIFSSVD